MGRIQGSLDAAADRLNSSLAFDQRMAEVDIQASAAWARALAKTGILTDQEACSIEDGLGKILDEFKRGYF